MRANDLLAGPRGRRVCWELTGFASFGLHGLQSSQVTERVARTVAELRADEADRLVLDALRSSVDAATYWQEPDECDEYLDAPELVELLRPLADELAANPATAWWDSPADLGHQHVVVFAPDEDEAPSSPPVLSGLRPAINELADEHAGPLQGRDGVDWRIVSGLWWSSPIARPGVVSTRAVADMPAGLLLVEDSYGPQAATSWPVRPAGAARVLELARPDDWAALVRRYPLDVSRTAKRGDWWRTTGRDGTWLMPDWPRVAADWDAVHLTVAGYLAAAGCALDLGDGSATVLGGWAPDATFWLNDLLEFAGEPTAWRADESDWYRL